MKEIFNKYIKSLAETTIQEKTEHTDRGHLKTLLTDLATIGKFNAQAINEQSRQGKNKDGFGAPDFTVNHTEKHTVIGYIENKQIDEKLDKILESKQIEKYKKLSENLILTDYLEWIWIYKDSEPVKVRLCNTEDLYDKKFKLNEEKANEVYNLIANFYGKEPDKIASAKVLAEKLARPSIELKRYITEQIDFQLKKENEGLRDELYAVYEIFKEGLFEELETKDFADGFAQMLTYSIFLAKLNSSQNLSLQNAKDHIPQAFSLIKTLGKFLDLLSEDKHKEIKWAVENILSVINNIDAFAIGESLSAKHGDEEKDPYIYFYEDFLKEYDIESRVNRGVYYTPPAVVQFIVNQVSNILEEDFNLAGGLANNKVKLLDFACGTGTFLFESYKKVLENTQKNSYEQNELIENLLKNFYGFEIMISSYIISHLKLSQFLKEQGFDISTKANKRIGVYLTNTLENKKDIQTNFFAKAVAEEGREANKIKDNKEIIAIIGNPPYNVSSQNILHDTNELLKFHETYKPKDEKKLNIDDDYIKFIAFAHKKINDATKGVIGVIVNNSFLKGLTHRKMRNELLKDFDKIYIIDLHGNARIGETAEDGSTDQNVFEIMQGVCIILLVKNKEIKNKGIFHIDLYGKRKEKFKCLYALKLQDTKSLNAEMGKFNEVFRKTQWGQGKNDKGGLRFAEDLNLFVPNKSNHLVEEYGNFHGLTDIFEEFGSGVKTDRDELVIDFEESKLISKTKQAFLVQSLILQIDKKIEQEEDANEKKKLKGEKEKYKDFINQYNITNSSSYKFADKLKTQDFDKTAITKVQYRPFDERFIYYKQGFTSRPAFETMQHMLNGDNVGLCFKRQNKNEFDYIFVASSIIECCLFESAYANVCIAPLYLRRTAKTEGLFLEAEDKKPNFKPEFAKMIAEQFGNITPEEVLAFIYAQMHSPAYRTKYLELLKIDFPRINFDVGVDEFKRLALIGQELIDAHLMKKIPNLKIGMPFDLSGNNFAKIICQKPTYNETEARIYIGKEVYFDGVTPEIWNFKIGGYQVLDKYLKERAERILTQDEIKNVSNIIKVLGFTIGKMGEV